MSEFYAAKVVEVAKSQIGYHETGKNITKYASDFDNKYPDFYNYKKQGVEWCDMFVDWCFITAFGESNALKLTCQPKKSAGAGCIYSYGYYKKKGQVGKEPKIGSQVFFGSAENNLSHTGIVVDVKDGKVFTVEGNANDQVSALSYPINSSRIFGYGYPKYDNAPETPQKPSEQLPTTKDINSIAKEVINGKWGNGADRKTRLEQAGYDYNEVQKKVNELLGVKSSTSSRKVTTTARSGLNVRAGAGTNYPIVACFPYGTKVDIYEEKNGWGRCQKGWISLQWTV